jgi:preprotein translocase subunit SecY
MVEYGHSPVDPHTKSRKVYIVLAYLSFLFFLPSLIFPFAISQLGPNVVPFIFASDILALLSGLVSLLIRARKSKEVRSNIALALAVIGIGGAILTIGIDAFLTYAWTLSGITGR